MPGFPKEERLLRRTDFVGLSEQGSKIHSPHFVVLWRERFGSPSRIGITVSKKIGNAVVRNRIKRLIREFYRLHKVLFAGAEFNIIARRGADSLDFVGICHELERALRRRTH